VTALKPITTESAFAAFQENVRSSLKVDALADFIILNKDLLIEPEQEIKQLKMLST